MRVRERRRIYADEVFARERHAVETRGELVEVDARAVHGVGEERVLEVQRDLRERRLVLVRGTVAITGDGELRREPGDQLGDLAR